MLPKILCRNQSVLVSKLSNTIEMHVENIVVVFGESARGECEEKGAILINCIDNNKAQNNANEKYYKLK